MEDDPQHEGRARLLNDVKESVPMSLSRKSTRLALTSLLSSYPISSHCHDGVNIVLFASTDDWLH